MRNELFYILPSPGESLRKSSCAAIMPILHPQAPARQLCSWTGHARGNVHWASDSCKTSIELQTISQWTVLTDMPASSTIHSRLSVSLSQEPQVIPGSNSHRLDQASHVSLAPSSHSVSFCLPEMTRRGVAWASKVLFAHSTVTPLIYGEYQMCSFALVIAHILVGNVSVADPPSILGYTYPFL